MLYKKKSNFLLLEVLIAFTLVVLCALPLIYPHVVLYQETKKFGQWENTQRIHQLLFASILFKMYENKIPWRDIEAGTSLPIDESFLNPLDPSLHLYSKGSYRFTVEKSKQSKDKSQGYYLLKLFVTYPEGEDEISFDVFAERNSL